MAGMAPQQMALAMTATTFDVEGCTFLTVPGAIGFDGPGPIAAAGAARRIRECGLTKLHVLDLCCGVGARLNYERLTGRKPRQCYVSDGLYGVRAAAPVNDGWTENDYFDLIVSNPPHNPQWPVQYASDGDGIETSLRV